MIVNPLMREHPWSAGYTVCRGGAFLTIDLNTGPQRRSLMAARRALASGFRLSLTLAFNIGDEESK